MTISDVITAKDRLIAHYNSPEYIKEQLQIGYTLPQIVLSIQDKTIALMDLEIALLNLELEQLKQSRIPVNIETEP